MKAYVRALQEHMAGLQEGADLPALLTSPAIDPISPTLLSLQALNSRWPSDYPDPE
jgi:hypothetical protein